jgi:acetyl esterase/lipase
VSELNRRALVKGGTAAFALCASAAVRGAVPADPLAEVNPQLLAAARGMLGYAKGPPLARNYLNVRRSIREGAQSARSDVPVEARRVPVQGGPDVLVYLINSTPGVLRPAILHMHGGGFVFGNAAAEVRAKQDLAKALDCVVATVDYRLAPESTWRASLEDNHAALKWLHDEAHALGVDRARIAIMGESAGGGHAALLALAARDRRQVPILLQVLIYPMLDDRTGSSHTPSPYVGRIGWSAADNLFGWRSFLGQPPGTRAVPSAAVPARAATVAGQPPAFIGVGAIDLFAEEDLAYARRLIDAGVSTELMVVPGAYHGFDQAMPDAPVSRSFTAAKMAALRRAFAS